MFPSQFPNDNNNKRPFPLSKNSTIFHSTQNFSEFNKISENNSKKYPSHMDFPKSFIFEINEDDDFDAIESKFISIDRYSPLSKKFENLDINYSKNISQLNDSAPNLGNLTSVNKKTKNFQKLTKYSSKSVNDALCDFENESLIEKDIEKIIGGKEEKNSDSSSFLSPKSNYFIPNISDLNVNVANSNFSTKSQFTNSNQKIVPQNSANNINFLIPNTQQNLTNIPYMIGQQFGIRVLFVKGLNFPYLTAQMIYNIFSNFGNIMKVVFMKNKKTALIEFTSQEFAFIAKDYLNNMNIFGFNIRVNKN